jgi:hypothetical protein
MTRIILILTLLPMAVNAQCPNLEAEGAFTGNTKVPSVKSQMWYNDGRWWGVFSDSSLGLFFYTLHNNTATKGALVDSDDQGKPDVLWDGNNLFVMIWKSVTLATLYKFSYDSSAQNYVLIPGFPVALNLNGDSSDTLVLEKDSTGKLWATYTRTQGAQSVGTIQVIWSTSADHKVWNTTGTVLEAGLTPNTTEISAITHFQGNKIGVAWSNRPAKEIAFRFHIDGDAETTWSAKEIIDSGLGPRGLGPVSNNHLSIQSAPDGRIFLVSRDSDRNLSFEARIWLYVRTASGIWGSKTIVEPDLTRGTTRPILILDVGSDRAFVLYHDDSPSGNGLNYITHSPMTNPSFAVPCAFSQTPANNLTSTKQNVTSNTRLIVAASTGGSSNQVVFRQVGLISSGGGLLCDVAPRPNGNGAVTIGDWAQVGRFVAGLDLPTADQFFRADANRNGFLSISDWVLCGRYAAGMDPPTPAKPSPDHE